jgi:hypothetical protein
MLDHMAPALAGTTVRRMYDQTSYEGRVVRRRRHRRLSLGVAGPAFPQLSTGRLAAQC